jgi:uncharacterized protein YxjI
VTSGLPVPTAARAVTRFAPLDRLWVRQRKRWVEILLSLEMKNAYDVFGPGDMPVLRVEEQGEGVLSFLKRIFVGPYRWFDAHVLDAGTRDLALALRRPFRFIFHELEVRAPDGTLLGTIRRRWSWFRRIYSIVAHDGRELAELFGPLFRPWTFEVQIDGAVRGMIQKRWGGLAKELFTDADNFRIDLEGIRDDQLRALVFAATVLIDVVHFERAKS